MKPKLRYYVFEVTMIDEAKDPDSKVVKDMFKMLETIMEATKELKVELKEACDYESSDHCGSEIAEA